jgi:hypothetical protein
VPDRLYPDDPLIAASPVRGRRADRLAAVIAGLGLAASVAGTLWFLAGFIETDPGFKPATSALLLSLGLGAFAIVPCAVVLRLALSAWKNGFRKSQGLWTLLLMVPWTGLGWLLGRVEALPFLLVAAPFAVALPLIIWAGVSLWLDRGTPGVSRELGSRERDPDAAES